MSSPPPPTRAESSHIGSFYPSWSHDWTSFLPGCNWRDFTFINLYVDWAHNTGRVAVEAALLGVHVGFQWVYDDDTPLLQQIRGMRDDFVTRQEPTDE
jgi:hypothetical protein